MSNNCYIYILSNYLRSVFYIGVTNNLCKRTWEHKEKLSEGFTKRYHIYDLVYYEIFTDIKLAIEREKQLKGWSRNKKTNLILSLNPKFVDLYSALCN